MDQYLQQASKELKAWQRQMLRRPGFFNKLSKKMQTKINSWIPEKVHKVITATLKQMIRGVLFGARYTTADPIINATLQKREELVLRKISNYRKTAAVGGGITGAGGLLMGLADFPILIGIKIKLLFDIVSLYGFDTSDYKERVYILHVFELAFSSHEHRRNVYLKMTNWEEKSKELPRDIN